LLEDPPQDSALSHDILEVYLVPGLVSPVHSFVGQPHLELSQLVVRDCAVQSDRHLIGELRQERDVLVIIGSGVTPTQEQRAKHVIPAHEGHCTGGSQPRPEQQGIAIDAEHPAVINGTGPESCRGEHMTGKGAVQLQDDPAVDDLIVRRDIDGAKPKLVGFRVGKGNERSIRARDMASGHRRDLQDITQGSIRESAPGYFEQQVYTLLLAAQLAMVEHLFFRVCAAYYAA
jgi:hypothetical protein